jgi:glutamine synthetase
MVFIPDIKTAAYDTFVEIPTLSMIGDVYVIGNPHRRFEQDPRAVAVHAEAYMRSTGIADEIRFGPEFEFYVFDHVSYEVKPQTIMLFHIHKNGGMERRMPEHICLQVTSSGVTTTPS